MYKKNGFIPLEINENLSKSNGGVLTTTREKRFLFLSGVTLVEVMVAIIIFMIVMLGGLAFFFYGRAHISRANHQRMALELTKERIELWKADDYANIITFSDPNIPLGSVQFGRNTVVVDHPVDGFKEVTVTTSWQEGGSPCSIQIITIIAQ